MIDKIIEEVKSIRVGNNRAWIFDNEGNISKDAIVGDIIPFLEELKEYEVDNTNLEEILTNGKAYNTCNYNCKISNDINFVIYGDYIAFMVHLVGDIRCNYTEYAVVKMADYEFLNLDSTIQIKCINDRFNANIYIFGESYCVYDDKNHEVGEFCHIDSEYLLNEL